MTMFCACTSSGERGTASRGRVEIGAPAPSYVATSLDGDSVSLAAQRGQVVLLNIWATWCHPCRTEIPGTSNKHQAWLAGITLKVTEFEHWRLEFERINSNFEKDRNVLTLQFQWIIGAHPAHKY